MVLAFGGVVGAQTCALVLPVAVEFDKVWFVLCLVQLCVPYTGMVKGMTHALTQPPYVLRSGCSWSGCVLHWSPRDCLLCCSTSSCLSPSSVSRTVLICAQNLCLA